MPGDSDGRAPYRVHKGQSRRAPEIFFQQGFLCKSVHLSSLRYTSLAVSNQIKGLRSLHLSIIQPEILPELSFFRLTYVIALVLAMVVLSSFTFVVKIYTAMSSRTDFGAVIPITGLPEIINISWTKCTQQALEEPFQARIDAASA